MIQSNKLTNPVAEFNGVFLRYPGGHDVLKEIQLTLEPASFHFLTGESGAGKTSLLRLLYLNHLPSKGRIRLFGQAVDTLNRRQRTLIRRKVGVVFQDFQLLTDRSVYDNLDFVLCATGWKHRGERKDRIEEMLQLVGMNNKGYKLPNELSGGEQQRIVIARAMLNSPRIILADEPTGNLDVETGRAIVSLLHQISEKGALVVMTTHNLQLLNEFPGKVYRCEGHRLWKVTEE